MKVAVGARYEDITGAVVCGSRQNTGHCGRHTQHHVTGTLIQRMLSEILSLGPPDELHLAVDAVSYKFGKFIFEPLPFAIGKRQIVRICTYFQRIGNCRRVSKEWDEQPTK